MNSASQHQVQFYTDDDVLRDSLVPIMRGALMTGHALLLVVSTKRRAAILGKLEMDGFDVPGLRAAGRIQTIDADRTLASVLEGGWPNARRFERRIGRAIRRLTMQFGGVAVFGEMVDILWQSGRRDAAIELEELWNRLQKSVDFRLFCAYRLDPLDPAVEVDDFERACRVHRHHALGTDAPRLEDAFLRAAREAVPTHNLEMLQSWITNGGYEEGSRINQGIIWLRRYMPELAAAVFKLTRANLDRTLASR